jgi:enediyne biosynthesis protein E4
MLPLILWVVVAAAGEQLAPFAEVAASEGVTFVHMTGATEEKMLPEAYGAGVAFADLDGDGDLDLYFVNSGSLVHGRVSAVNRIYRNGGDAEVRFEQLDNTAGAAGVGYGMGALAGDFDGDGDIDLYTTEVGSDRLYANAGDAVFHDITADAGIDSDTWGTSAVYFDADLDGDLDLFVADYVAFSTADNPWCGRRDLDLRFYCDPRQYEPLADRLYLNDGNDSNRENPVFHEVGAEQGITRKGNGLGVVAGDFDGDGDADIYVANDMTANFLYHNDGTGMFTEDGLVLGTAFSADGAAQAGMGVDTGDYDDDGDIDLVVTNYQLEHNALYRNENTWWTEAGFSTGLGEASVNFLGFGVGFFDFDNDSRLDLFVANGHVHDNIETYDPMVTHAQRAQVFHNEGSVFVEVPADKLSGGLVTPYVGRGSAFGDYDNDGDVDVALNTNGGAAVLLRNDTAVGNWLRLALVGLRGNTSGIGARIRLLIADRTLTRWVAAGSGYLSTSEAVVHVGTGTAAIVDRVEVLWPSGVEQVFSAVPCGQLLRIKEPTSRE